MTNIDVAGVSIWACEWKAMGQLLTTQNGSGPCTVTSDKVAQYIYKEVILREIQSVSICVHYI
jgi:hypothetical protein